jgi:4-amino-4-deoxy-L-arabinose transferase-like glycosyltransferase
MAARLGRLLRAGRVDQGPGTLVLVAVPLVALAFLERRRLSWQALSLYLGIVLLVAMPWYAAVAAVAPDAAIEFLWLHNIVRYLAPLDHEQPVWYYAPSLLLGALPWTLLLLPMGPYLLRRSTRAGRRRPAPLGGFLLALVACLAFFSLSGCKRPAYILPAFPLLALSMATYVTYGLPWRRWLDRARAAHPVQQLGHRLALSLLACTCLLAVGGAAGMAVLGHWSWPQVLVVAMGLGAFMGIAWQLQQGSTAAMSWAGCAAALFVLLLLGVREALPHYHRRHVLRPQVQEQQDLAQAPMPIICYPKRYDSISFYLGRDVAAYAPDQKAALLRQLESQGEALLFVKRDGGALADLLQTLPEGWEFLQRGPAGTKVVTGVVRARP